MCTDDDQCKLICVAIGYSFRYDFGNVIDGTRCEQPSDDGDFVCVGGRCLVSFIVFSVPTCNAIPNDTDSSQRKLMIAV